jgi:hypothetical protein
LIAVPLAAVRAQDPPAAPAARALRIVTQRLADPNVVPIAPPQEAPPTSEYWIGIGLGELTDIVKKQLGIEHGLVVNDAFPDSPAAKAGFQQHDILIKVGDKALQEPAELVKAVDEAKETELSIALLRGGKEMTLKVTPMKRPQPEALETRVVRVPVGASSELQAEIKKLEEALAQLKGKVGGDGLSLMFARPGVVTARAYARSSNLPKDVSVTVTKEGEQPAKIHVKKGDQEWNVTEDKMGELPDDVRPHVHQFFGRLWAPGLKEMAERSLVGGPKVAPYAPTPTVPAPPPPATSPVPAPPTASGEARTPRAFSYRIESRGTDDKLDEIMKELKSLRKDLDELRGKSADEKK